MGAPLTPLCRLGEKYGTDKYHRHKYTPLYFEMLYEKAPSVHKMAEVGIGVGAKSLQMWEEFFPNASIYGIDVNNATMHNKGRIRSFKLDQASNRDMTMFGKKYGPFNVIVEDGDHNPRQQIAAMTSLLRFLTKDGLYFIEDIRGHLVSIQKAIPKGFKWCIVHQSAATDEHCHLMCICRA